MSRRTRLLPEPKQLWLTALRFGDYEQARGKLRVLRSENRASGYCCLGVLCEVAAQSGVALDRETEIIDGDTVEQFDRCYELPPTAVTRWAFGTPYNSDDIYTHLATMNDDEARSFEEIANWVEEEL